jgi:D-lactate dehydrogenase (cytochrome)
VQFPTLDGAVACVMDVMQAGIAMARIELLDALQMEACIRWSGLAGLAPLPSLFLEFHGSAGTVAEQVAAVAEIAAGHGGQGFAFAESAEARSRLWKARHDAYHAARALAPGKDSLTTDACVPISRLADCINACRADAEALQLVAPIVGHVGDGNFHMLVLCDPADPDERARAETLCARVAVHALACGGTITGEHGIGIHKLTAMRAEHDDGALDVMRAIKAALDPAGLLNPGKTVPAA